MTQIATSRDADPALAARVRRTLGAPDAGPLAVLEGGRSGLTYVISDRGTRRVVKAVPPGSKAVGRNDVLRQSYVLSALAGRDVPVPRVIARDAEEPAWFAMEFAEGAALEPVFEPLPVETSRRRMVTAAAVLGRLHAVPPADLGPRLREAGRKLPAPADPADELERWTRTMHAVPEELRPGSAELLAALAANVPPPVAPVLVHGDFRLGNLMFAGDAPTALVDWEIWGVGDPRVDLGWFGVFTDGELFPGVGRAVPGLPSEDDLDAAYRESRGCDGGTAGDIAWFRALGRMKMAAIMGHNLRRHREGRHHDPVQEQLPPTIAALIASGLELVT
ncbi:phosphotransferase family protein [Pseudonocardia sp. DSM 110487]|uniref:phosphotransferase family protein n=1 Tax=Pseudonocardia sp. DSM 110487 TaxID=2865833 RepID=UPI001C69C64D|nr:phosphotransferase family protein [Pseudonocardia sp. DSM 110487]QYN39042.1 phosphotransferase family protein [Pseudonocardia sp. DSM 110487]